MKAKIIKWIVGIICVALIATLVVSNVYTTKHNKSLKAQVDEQSKIIDSLLARRMNVIDAKLYVTDKSKNVVYGKYNKGTIYVPQEKKYLLEIDSIILNR